MVDTDDEGDSVGLTLFGSGDTLTSSSTSSSGDTENMFGSGPWEGYSGTGYVGLTKGSGTGWVELDYQAGTGGGSVELVSYAYNSSGTLAAGSTAPVAAVPEPKQAALLVSLFAIGAAAFSRRRRRAE